MDDIEVLSMSGRNLSRAWLAAQLAASDDSERPALYRRVLLEVFDVGVMLVATDSYWLCRAWVPHFPDDDVRPEVDEVPVSSLVIADVQHRFRDLMGFVRAATKKDDADHPDIDVVLAPTSGYDEAVPTLDPSLAEPKVVASIPGERLVVPASEIEFPSWRGLMVSPKASKGRIALAPWILARLARVATFTGAVGLEFEFRKESVYWRAMVDDIDVDGLVMPLRLDDEDET